MLAHPVKLLAKKDSKTLLRLLNLTFNSVCVSYRLLNLHKATELCLRYNFLRNFTDLLGPFMLSIDIERSTSLTPDSGSLKGPVTFLSLSSPPAKPSEPVDPTLKSKSLFGFKDSKTQIHTIKLFHKSHHRGLKIKLLFLKMSIEKCMNYYSKRETQELIVLVPNIVLPHRIMVKAFCIY